VETIQLSPAKLVGESLMNIQLNARDINDKKWKDHWEAMTSCLKNRLEGCLFLIDEHSIGISRNRKCFQVYGAEESFKFDDNSKVYIKAENKKTGKLVKVYEYLKESKEVKRCSQAHIIHNSYNEEDIKFLKELMDAVVDYYRPNSIKFITDNF